jgi:pimeloyl-ACP methyl ester carboxylesterase
VVFLHGASFNAQTWVDNGILAATISAGFCCFAVDIPGYGQSEAVPHDRLSWITALLEILEVDRPALISPSMSGGYSLPFAAAHPEKLAGLVAVAPVRIADYAPRLANSHLPLLAIWGENDSQMPPSQADALVAGRPERKKVVLTGAGHACYMNKPKEFTAELLAFLKKLGG